MMMLNSVSVRCAPTQRRSVAARASFGTHTRTPHPALSSASSLSNLQEAIHSCCGLEGADQSQCYVEWGVAPPERGSVVSELVVQCELAGACC